MSNTSSEANPYIGARLQLIYSARSAPEAISMPYHLISKPAIEIAIGPGDVTETSNTKLILKKYTRIVYHK